MESWHGVHINCLSTTSFHADLVQVAIAHLIFRKFSPIYVTQYLLHIADKYRSAIFRTYIFAKQLQARKGSD